MTHPWRVLTLCLLGGTAACAAPLRLPAIADTNLSAYSTERGLNYGASSGIRIKGIEMFYLARFDLAVIARYFPEFERELPRYLT